MATVPLRYWGLAAGDRGYSKNAPTSVPSPFTQSTTATYAAGKTGATRLVPSTAVAVGGNDSIPGAPSAGSGTGWNDQDDDYPTDSGNGTSFQARYQTTISGNWTFVTEVQAAVGSVPVGMNATFTIIAYAVTAASARREVARFTSASFAISTVAANVTVGPTNPGNVVLNAGERLAYEVYLNVTANGSLAAVTVIFTTGAASLTGAQCSIQAGTTIAANIFAPVQSVAIPVLATLGPKQIGKREVVAVPLLATMGPRQIGKRLDLPIPLLPTLTKKVTPDPLAVAVPILATVRKAITPDPIKATVTILATQGPRQVGKRVDVAVPVVATMTRQTGKVLTVAIPVVPTMARLLRLQRILSSTTQIVVKAFLTIPFDKVPGGGQVIVKKIFSVFD